MKNEEYIKELRKLYSLAMAVDDVPCALELLERIRCAEEPLHIPEQLLESHKNIIEQAVQRFIDAQLRGQKPNAPESLLE